jgi:hypothetical protein
VIAAGGALGSPVSVLKARAARAAALREEIRHAYACESLPSLNAPIFVKLEELESTTPPTHAVSTGAGTSVFQLQRTAAAGPRYSPWHATQGRV